MKPGFTTGQVGKLCKVAARTVGKWFDSGRLRGYRVPGSQDRRIPRQHLLAFLKEHGMQFALDELDRENRANRILVITLSEQDVPDDLREELAHPEIEWEICKSLFEAGVKFGTGRWGWLLYVIDEACHEDGQRNGQQRTQLGSEA